MAKDLNKASAGLLRQALACAVLGFGVSGCYVLHDLSPDQCETNSECVTQFGSGFVCNSGICEEASASEPEGTAASSMDGEAESCETHADCIAALGDVEPHACVEGECVPLTSEECPLVLPMRNEKWLDNLTTSDAVIFGGYSPIPAVSRISHFTRFYDLALDEFTQEVGGLLTRGLGRRQVVMVICEGGSPERASLATSAEHLMNTLKVPGVVSTLQSDDLQFVFEEYGRDAGTFFVSGLDADESILNLVDDGLVWTMLAGAESLAEPFAPLMDRVDQYVRYRQWVAEDEDTRVALVAPTASPRLLAELGAQFRDRVSFNGKPADENFPDNLRVIDITTVYEDEQASQDQSQVIGELLDFAPHVIYAMASDEFLQRVVFTLEQEWQVEHDQALPFYVLSPYHLGSKSMDDAIGASLDFPRRVVGLGYASAEDQTVYRDYLIRLEQAYPDVRDDPTRLGKENFYDAPYYLLYAAVAAGNPPKLTGSLMAQGMTRLTQGQVFTLGREDMREATSVLQTDARNTIMLKGTLGLASFDLSTGARADSGSIFCLTALGEFVPDALRWDTARTEFVDADPSIDEVCIPGF